MISSIYKKELTEDFRGIVVGNDAEDEFQYGRIKVKVWGIYPDDVKPEELPWAWPETPGIIGGKFQSGWSSVPELGSIVLVRFDYGDINAPIFKGTVPGLQHKPQGENFDNTIPVYGKKDDKTLLDKKDGHEQDFHRLAMSSLEIDYEQDMDNRWMPLEESPESFEDEEKWNISWKAQHKNTVYPYNHVFSSGRHTLEYDNTDGYERVSLSHWNGSYISLDWEGDVINKSFNNQWILSEENNIEWSSKNKVALSKNNVKMVGGDDIQMVAGTTARYFGIKGEPDYNYEGEDVLAEVFTESGTEGAKTYWKFAGNLEYKLENSWILEIMENLHMKIYGDSNTCISGQKVENVSGVCDVSSGGNMNLNAPLIRLNCGAPASADCPETTDPLINSLSDPDRKAQGETSEIQEKGEALVELINKEVGAKCELLKTGDVATFLGNTV